MEKSVNVNADDDLKSDGLEGHGEGGKGVGKGHPRRWHNGRVRLILALLLARHLVGGAAREVVKFNSQLLRQNGEHASGGAGPQAA